MLIVFKISDDIKLIEKKRDNNDIIMELYDEMQWFISIYQCSWKCFNRFYRLSEHRKQKLVKACCLFISSFEYLEKHYFVHDPHEQNNDSTDIMAPTTLTQHIELILKLG